MPVALLALTESFFCQIVLYFFIFFKKFDELQSVIYNNNK